jgi:hypothetical protein
MHSRWFATRVDPALCQCVPCDQPSLTNALTAAEMVGIAVAILALAGCARQDVLDIITVVWAHLAAKFQKAKQQRAMGALVPSGTGPLFFRHIRQNERLPPLSQRNPRISLAAVIFTLLSVICLGCKFGQSSGRFPCSVAL